jgi:hypothetical protein
MSAVECGVCYDELSLNKNTCTTSCGHQFCMGCFIKCTQQSNKCPLCRVELYEEEEYNEDDDEDYEEEDEEDDGNTSGDDETSELGEESKLTIEQIEERLVREGYTMKHILCMLFDDIRSSSAEFGKINRDKFYQEIDNIANDMLSEAEEIDMMGGEDINVLAETPKIGTLENPHVLIPRRITRTELTTVSRNLADEFETC